MSWGFAKGPLTGKEGSTDLYVQQAYIITEQSQVSFIFSLCTVEAF